MSLPVLLRRIAQIEYDEAAARYESRKTGLGVRFVAALQGTIQFISISLIVTPEVWPEIREAPVLHWPYCVYYQVHSDHVMVIVLGYCFGPLMRRSIPDSSHAFHQNEMRFIGPATHFLPL